MLNRIEYNSFKASSISFPAPHFTLDLKSFSSQTSRLQTSRLEENNGSAADVTQTSSFNGYRNICCSGQKYGDIILRLYRPARTAKAPLKDARSDVVEYLLQVQEAHVWQILLSSSLV